MRALYPALAISLGSEVAVAAAVLGSTPLLALGLVAIAAGTADLMRLAGVTAAQARDYLLDCVLLLAVFLVLSLFKPSIPDAPHELD